MVMEQAHYVARAKKQNEQRFLSKVSSPKKFIPIGSNRIARHSDDQIDMPSYISSK